MLSGNTVSIVLLFGVLPNAAKRRESGSPGRQPWESFLEQDKPRSGGRASDAAAPSGLGCTCTGTPGACALGYVLTPLRGLGNLAFDYLKFPPSMHPFCPRLAAYPVPVLKALLDQLP